MTHATITATAHHYQEQWTLYMVEQYSSSRMEHVSPAARQWMDAAVRRRIARTGVDRSTVLQTIEQELRGETPDHQRRVMIPEQLGDMTGTYILVIDDRVQVHVNERGKRVWSVVQELPVPQP